MFSYLLPAAVLATLVFSSPLWEGLFLCSLANMFSAAACLILPPNFLAGKLCRATGETAGLYFCFWVSQDFLPAPSKEWLCTFWWVLKNRTRLEMVKLHFYFYLKGVISTCVLVRCLSPVWGCCPLPIAHALGQPPHGPAICFSDPWSSDAEREFSLTFMDVVLWETVPGHLLDFLQPLGYSPWISSP